MASPTRSLLHAVLASTLLATSATACGVVLGIPSETRNVEEVPLLFCSCPLIAGQPPDIEDACLAAKEEANETDFFALAEQGCNECGKARDCYQELTGAGKIGDSCRKPAECASFACCFAGFAGAGGLASPIGECCEECAGCQEQFAQLEFPVAEPLPGCFGAQLTLASLADCLCGETRSLTGCENCPASGNPLLSCDINAPDCDCWSTQAEGNFCSELFTACTIDPSRPVR